MRILTVVYDLGVGGTQRAGQNFANAYSDLGHESRIWATQALGVRESQLRSDIHVYPPGTSFDALDEWSPDVVHLISHGLTETFVKNLHSSTANRAQWVEHNVFADPMPWSQYLDRTYVFSEWCTYQFFTRAPSSTMGVGVVPLPVDTTTYARDAQGGREFRSRHSIPQDAVVIGRVGQPLLYKWSETLVPAFESIAAKNERVWLMLKGAPVEIQQSVLQSDFRNRITLIDELDENDMPNCYSAMDVMAHAADQGEAFGYVLVEAMLCEVPIVTVPTPWGDNSQGEVVGHEIGGLVATTYQGFIRALSLLCAEAESRRKYGQQGRNRVLEKYSAHDVALQTLEMLTNPPSAKRPTRETLVQHYAQAIDPPGVPRTIIFRLGMFKTLAWVSGFHSFTWLLRSTLNSWGISRYGIGRLRWRS